MKIYAFYLNEKRIMLTHTNTTHKKEESLISDVIDCRQECVVPKKKIDGQFVIARTRLLARSE